MDKLPLVPQIYLGSEGLIVSQEGLGCMGMSAFYGPPKPEDEMIELIRYAIEAGVTFLDTADIYGPHTNEILVGKVGLKILLTLPARSFAHRSARSARSALFFLASRVFGGGGLRRADDPSCRPSCQTEGI